MKLTFRDEILSIMRELACFGIEKRLIKHYSNLNPRVFDDYYNSYSVVPHREGMTWIKSPYESHLGDRVIRVYEHVVGIEASDECEITPKQLLEVTKAYLAIYPRDDMSVNRIYYLLRSIKAGIVGIERSCITCHKPYHVHGIPGRKCGMCNILAKRNKTPRNEIFSFVRGSATVNNNIGYLPTE